MSTTDELNEAIRREVELVQWCRSNSYVSRMIDADSEMERETRTVLSMLQTPVPDRPSPAFAEDMFFCVKQLLALRLYIQAEVSPALHSRALNARDDRATISMTLSVLDQNIGLMLDASADLYVAVARWIGLDVALPIVREKFREMTEPDSWFADQLRRDS